MVETAIGSVLGGVLGGIFGGGDGDGGISKSAAQCFGQGAASTWALALSPLIAAASTFGLIRQYELQRDALALAERGVVIAERTIELSERNYNEIAVPIFQRMRDYFDDCVPDMKNVQRAFIDKAFGCEEYVPDYEGQEARAKFRVASQFTQARKQTRRSRGKGAVGYICDQDIRFSIAQAQAASDAANRGYRFEDARKIQLDQQCFERCQVAASLANSITGQVFNGLNGAASVVNNALTGVSRASNSLVEQLNQAANSTTNNADFFGSIANGGFNFLGSNSFQAPATNSVFGSPFGFGGGGSGFGGGSGIFNNGFGGNQGVPLFGF